MGASCSRWTGAIVLVALFGLAGSAAAQAPLPEEPRIAPDAVRPLELDAVRVPMLPLDLQPRPQVAIDAVRLSNDASLPGETIEAIASVRNTGPVPLERVAVSFFANGQEVGAPVVLADIAPGAEAEVALPLRQNTLGRVTLQAAAVPVAPGPLTTRMAASEASSPKVDVGLRALPAWWQAFDTLLEEAELPGLHRSYSRIPGLDSHTRCATDLRTEMILQRHGQAIMDAVASRNNDPDRTKTRLLDAVNELGKITRALYCMDLQALRYWDKALAAYWRQQAAASASGLDFTAALIATWNPALLVIDAVQFTGHSEILEAFDDLQPQIEKALQAYPADIHGAAWLDAFGNGQLVRLTNPAAMDNLLAVLREPSLLGLGQCSLAAHAGKAFVDQPCFAGLAQVSPTCSSADLGDLLAQLNETHMLVPLIEGNLARGAGSSPSGSGPALPVTPQDLSAFGAPLAAQIGDLCAKLSQMQPQGLQGIAEQFAGAFAQLDGCVFGIVGEGLTGAGGGVSGRALQCFAQYATQVPPPIETTQIAFPTLDCAAGSENRPDAKDVLESLQEQGLDVEASQDEKTGRITLRVKMPAPGEGQAGVTVELTFSGDGFLLESTERSATDSSGNLLEYELTTYGQDGSTHTISARFARDGTMTRTESLHDGKGHLLGAQTKSYKDGKQVGPTRTNVPPRAWRPVDGTGGTCGETAAMRRARARFQCVFGAPGTVDPRGTLIPVIRQLDPSAPLPAACNGLNPSALWGSTTGPGVYDPPPWRLSGGPAIFQSFIPEIDGVIDPLRDRLAPPRP